MQVMQAQESQTEIMIGQKNKTREYGVSNDASLMSMLSTGFYGNPLRTMIQEVMFNSWDAHKMANITDTPINIYIDANNGLTFRDFGPGIHDDDMEQIYCVYGNSTKRFNDAATGGFGLGSKSPFAYTESFTVISQHEGEKNIYAFTRVSDTGNGKPGMNQLVTVPTTEQGLTVIIPLKKNDFDKAVKYVNDLLYLSGVKAKITTIDEEGNQTEELIESKNLTSGEYWLEDRQQRKSTGNLWAVYGGVRYKIPMEIEYGKEMAFLKIIANISDFYIGFGPSTLTPLPNREGLNLNEKCKEQLRLGFERYVERFQEVIDPAVNAFIRHMMAQFKKQNIEPAMAFFLALNLSSHDKTSATTKFYSELLQLVPFNTDPKIWAVIVQIMELNIRTIVKTIGYKRWMVILCNHYIREFPTGKQIAYAALKMEPYNLVGRSPYNTDNLLKLTNITLDPILLRHAKFRQKMSQTFEDKSLRAVMRLCRNNFWHMTTNDRSQGKDRQFTEERAKHVRKFSATPPKVYKLYSTRDKTELLHLLSEQWVFLAKTVACLDDTDTSTDKYLYKRLPEDMPTDRFFYWRDRNYQKENMIPFNEFKHIPAYVVPDKKGAYDTAKAELEALGFKVIECREPDPKPKFIGPVMPEPKKPQGFLLADASRKYFEPSDMMDTKNYTDTPEYYIHVTKRDMDSDGYSHQYFRPKANLLTEIQRHTPNIVMCHTQYQFDKLTGAHPDVKPLHEALDPMAERILNQVYRSRNLVRYNKIQDISHLPPSMLMEPEIQKVMGMVVVDTVKDPDFYNDALLLRLLSTDSWATYGSNMKIVVSSRVSNIFSADPQYQKISKACETSKLFYAATLDHEYRGSDEARKQVIASQVARFIRAF